MIYKIFYPASFLAEVVEHYWYTKVDLTESAVSYHATPLLQGLAFSFKKCSEEHRYNGETLHLNKEAYLFGQPTCPRLITSTSNGIDILGVKFKPLGIAKITGISMEYMADRIIPAEDIWGNELESICDQMQSANSLENSIAILESFLLKKYLKTSLHYRIDHVRDAILLIDRSKGILNVKTLRHQTNTTRKTLERAFLNYVGLMPKLYCEIVRFNNAKYLMDNNPSFSVNHIAFEAGYYDNSHLSSDFKRFSGLTPTAYRENRETQKLEHLQF